MTVISYNKARENLKKILNQVHDNQLMETMNVLQSPKNAERLLESVRQLQQKST